MRTLINHTKDELTPVFQMGRSTYFYHEKQPRKDWALKQEIEIILREHPSYGYRRIALALKVNKKRAQRVMQLYGIKPYRRRGRKPKKTSTIEIQPYENLLLTRTPLYPHHIWVSDFTYISFKGKFVYLATLMDLVTRELVGFSLMRRHSADLVQNALLMALFTHPRPSITHSDQGREYTSKQYLSLLETLGIKISMSHKGSPWENGYQESFYSQFKVDLGDPNRFETLGELVFEIYRLLYVYNNTRIHSALKMPPIQFAQQQYGILIKQRELAS